MKYKSNSVLDFGEYRGVALGEVAKFDPIYVRYLCETMGPEVFDIPDNLKSKVGVKCRLKMSPKMVECFQFMDTPISRRISGMNGIWTVTGVTDVDVGPEPGTITGIRTANGREVTMKVGKFVADLIEENGLVRHDMEGYTPRDVEIFTNDFKAIQSFDHSDTRLELVRGNDIATYYFEGNYAGREGSLGNSCMRHASCTPYLKLYCLNPNDVAMLILHEDTSNRIVARAIVWQNTTIKTNSGVLPTSTFMDRVYSTRDFHEKVLKMYAERRGWAYKSVQSAGHNEVTHHRRNYSGEITARVARTRWDFYPYMDTLKHLYDGKVSNMRSPGYLGMMSSTGGTIGH